MLVYEYVNNGNLEQWLHGAMSQRGSLTWEARIKILLGTAKALVQISLLTSCYFYIICIVFSMATLLLLYRLHCIFSGNSG